MTAPNTPAETSDQLNKPAKSGKLEVSDLITIGVFAALYFVMVCIATLVSTLFTGGFGSIFLPAITALISGCVYMLLAARLGKFGGITVMGVIIGLFLFISGHFVLSFIASIVFPVAADLIARAGKYKSKALLLVSYVVFSYGLTGPILPLWFMKDAYVASLQARGKDAAYIDGVFVNINSNHIDKCRFIFIIFRININIFHFRRFGNFFIFNFSVIQISGKAINSHFHSFINCITAGCNSENRKNHGIIALFFFIKTCRINR